MKFKQRFSFWRVFWVMLCICAFFAVISLIALSLVPEKGKEEIISTVYTWNYLAKSVIRFLFSTFFFYFTINYYFTLITERKPFISYLKVSVIALIVSLAYYHVLYMVFPSTEQEKQYATVALLLFSMALNSLIYIGLSLLIAYFTNLRDGQKHRKVLEAQKMQLEVEKSQANFNFLKAQINPHFLHNTLNFLYAKSLPYSPELSEGILTLSDIMRYALSEGNAKDGKAPLKDEIEHVRNVIKINQLRYSNNLNVNFEVNGVVNNSQIIPFVLITLVENAFKHGDLKKQEYPIDIKLNIEKNKLYFYCRNKKKTGPKELSTGIGLENIKNRLNLAYGDKYRLNVKDEPEFYTTELIINQL